MHYHGLMIFRLNPGFYLDMDKRVGESMYPDLALVKLAQKVKFIPYLINPICVPPTPDFDDMPSDAFVGGWGADSFACGTNENGPNPHTQCKFPFTFKGQVFQSCTRMPTPSSHNHVCQELFRWAFQRKFRPVTGLNQGNSLLVYYWDEKTNKAAYTSCYK